MKKWILIISLCILISPVWIWASDTKIVVDDYYSCRFLDADSQYAYGYTYPGILMRMDVSGTFTGCKNFREFDANYTISAVYAPDINTGDGQLVFAVVRNALNNCYFLFKSVDSGTNWGNNAPYYNNGDYVLKFGWDADGWIANGNNPTQIPKVRTLYSRSFCLADINGITTLLIGEYNVNKTRIGGADNDQVRIMKSTDIGAALGDTWTEVVHYNTDGSENNTRHIHCIKQDPYSKYIYIAYGDSNPQSGIIRWDGTSTLINNSTSDFAVAGAQRYRTADFLFLPDCIYLFSDTHSIGQSGIWKASKDLSSYIRVDSKIESYDCHAGLFGLKLDNGTLIFGEILEATAIDRQINIYASGDDGKTWNIVGKWTSAIASVIVNLIKWNGKVFASGRDAAGKQRYITAVFSFSGDYDTVNDEPEIVHPVYWVSPHGVNSEGSDRGYRPSLPWATLEYALEEGRITYGAKVIVGPGEYEQAACDFDCDSNLRPGTGRVWVKGAGENISSTYLPSDDTYSNQAYYIESSSGTILFEGLKLYSKKEGVNIVKLGSGASVTFRKTIIGDKDFDVYSTVFSQGAILNIDKCELQQPLNSFHDNLWVFENENQVRVTNSIIHGGRYGVSLRAAGGNFSMFHSIIYHYNNTGVILYDCADSVPILKNNIFFGQDVSDYWISDFMSMIETDERINYNCYYNGSFSNIANDGGFNKVLADPEFVLPGIDYHLQDYSPCIGAGTYIPGIEFDVDGDYIASYHPQNIGIDHTTKWTFTGIIDDLGRSDCSGDCEGDFDQDGDVDGSDIAVLSADFEGIYLPE